MIHRKSPVGASLLAIEICLTLKCWMFRHHREQARSHI
ncbi:hypothetical protein EMIT0P74_70123 [Pseudomonas sp. IT-P74]